MGPGGPGFLNAALGGGALLAGFVTAFLVGRRHLANTLTVTLSIAVVALALIGALPKVAPAIVLIATVGLAGAVFDVTGRTLLQRSAPSDAIAGSFSILEALMDTGLALGAVLVRVAIAIGGLKAALFAPAILAFVLIAGLWHRIHKIDASATVPQVEIQLLRSISIFAALPAPSLESLARDLEPLTVSQGTIVIKEGERGDRYYAVAEGELAVSRLGEDLQMVSRGDGFGEIALIRDVPRQATVIAAPTPCFTRSKGAIRPSGDWPRDDDIHSGEDHCEASGRGCFGMTRWRSHRPADMTTHHPGSESPVGVRHRYHVRGTGPPVLGRQGAPANIRRSRRAVADQTTTRVPTMEVTRSAKASGRTRNGLWPPGISYTAAPARLAIDRCSSAGKPASSRHTT